MAERRRPSPIRPRVYDKQIPPQEAALTGMGLVDMVSYVGWSLEEFVEATRDYHPDNKDYDWHKTLKNLWEATYNRIHSYLDLRHRFRYYNNWKHVIDYVLALNKIRVMDTEKVSEMTLQALEDDLRIHNIKNILPTEELEKQVLWALASLIVELHDYMCEEPIAAFEQLEVMRETIDERLRIAENKRVANRERRASKKNKKKNRK